MSNLSQRAEEAARAMRENLGMNDPAKKWRYYTQAVFGFGGMLVLWWFFDRWFDQAFAKGIVWGRHDYLMFLNTLTFFFFMALWISYLGYLRARVNWWPQLTREKIWRKRLLREGYTVDSMTQACESATSHPKIFFFLVLLAANLLFSAQGPFSIVAVLCGLVAGGVILHAAGVSGVAVFVLCGIALDLMWFRGLAYTHPVGKKRKTQTYTGGLDAIDRINNSEDH